MGQFTSLNPLLQSFLCSANEAIALREDAVSRLNSGLPVCATEQRRVRESWDRLQLEIQRLRCLRQMQGISCIIAASLNERFLITLELYREAAYLTPTG